MHHRNIQVLATELYKFVNGLSPKLVSDCFKLNNMTVYNNRSRSTFYSRPVRTVLHSTESLSLLGPKIEKLVPSDMKNLLKLTAFKKAIKQWKPRACSCRLCRIYICQNNLFLHGFLVLSINYIYVIKTLFIVILFIFLYFC